MLIGETTKDIMKKIVEHNRSDLINTLITLIELEYVWWDALNFDRQDDFDRAFDEYEQLKDAILKELEKDDGNSKI